MRITNNLLIHNMLWNMNNNLVSMNEKQTQLATGKRIHKPSDDPVGTTRVIKVKSDIVENQQYKDNVRDAQSWLDVSENSLMDTKDILQRIRELAVQGANDTYTDQETDKIAQEIDQLLEELIVNANSTMAGRYLFSGFQTDEPLMNEDGSYNIDITSEKMNEFKSIAYEVAVGENLTVGTNYLDVYGIVESDNTVVDSFKFKETNGDIKQYAESTGAAATHSKAQFIFDHRVDLTAATTELTYDGITYTLDATKLTGTISQEEFLEILSNAEQTTPPPPAPPAATPTLGQVAEMYYVSGDDSSNTLGELVIEAKDFGPKVFDVSSMATLTYDAALPTITTGTAEVIGVNAKVSGYFDYSKDLTDDLLNFVIGGTEYVADVSKFDGTLTEEEFLEVIDSAVDSTGKKLKDSMNVTFEPSIGTRGVLTIESKIPLTESIIVKDTGEGFSDFPKVTAGINGDGGTKARIKGSIDLSANISGSAPGDLTFTVNGKTYTVDTTTMNGGLAPDAVIDLFEAADDGSGNKLGDVAEIKFVGSAPPNYELEIEARQSETSTTALVDNSSLFTAGPFLRDGELDEDSYAGVRAQLDGPVDLTQNIAGDLLTFTFDDRTYTVNTVAMNGSISAEDFLEDIEEATDGLGGQLSDIAYISFANDENPYELIIQAKDPVSYSPSAVDDGGIFATGLTSVDGVERIEGVPASVEGTLDLTKDITGSTLSYTIAGTTYTVATGTMNGTLSAAAVQTLIENAPDGGGGQLSDVATVTVDTTVNPYAFTIEEITPSNAPITVVDSGNVYVESPYTLGVKTVEPVKASIEGNFDLGVDLTGDTLTFEVDGTTYTIDTSTMDGSLSGDEVVDLLKSAPDGSGGKLGDWMLVTFEPTTGTEGTLKIEQKTASTAVVNYTDSGSGFTVAATETDGAEGIVSTKAIVTGAAKISDEMLAHPVTGSGIQSYVVAYNDETKRIDVDLTDVDSIEEFKAAMDKELNTAFGDDGGSPPINNVTFDLKYDGTNNVVQFTGAGKDDGSETFLKVDVVVSSKPEMMQDIEDFSTALTNKDNEGINEFIDKLDDHLNNVLSVLANIGAKTNRLDFIENRIDDNNIAMTEILTKVQDIDYAEVTIQFKSLESIYRASLSVGGKVIQPTLVDFIQ